MPPEHLMGCGHMGYPPDPCYQCQADLHVAERAVIVTACELFDPQKGNGQMGSGWYWAALSEAVENLKEVQRRPQ